MKEKILDISDCLPSESDDQIIQVNNSMVSDGVKMTLAEAIPGEIDGVVILAFERVNGQTFRKAAIHGESRPIVPMSPPS